MTQVTQTQKWKMEGIWMVAKGRRNSSFVIKTPFSKPSDALRQPSKNLSPRSNSSQS